MVGCKYMYTWGSSCGSLQYTELKIHGLVLLNWNHEQQNTQKNGHYQYLNPSANPDRNFYILGASHETRWLNLAVQRDNHNNLLFMTKDILHSNCGAGYV